MSRRPRPPHVLSVALLTLAATGSILTPATAASEDLDGGLLFFGGGYSKPTPYVDEFNALAGRQAATISSSALHACVVDTLGDAECWGYVGDGQLGAPGSSGSYSPPSRVLLDAVGDPKLATIDAGESHTCALTQSARALCWGSDAQGRLGNGSVPGRGYTPVRVETSHIASDPTWVDISAGGSHTCAIDDAGRAFCWGNGYLGQVGTGALGAYSRPQRVADGDIDGRHLVDIDTGGRHTCAVDVERRVYCWGENRFGQLGVSDTRDRLVPRLVPDTGPRNNPIVEVSAGLNHTCGVTVGQRLFCWGWNRNHQVSTSDRTRVLRPNWVEGLNAVHVSAGWLQTCAVTGAGAAWCWGANRYGQIGDGTHNDALQPTPVLTDEALAGRQLVAIQAGRRSSVALDTEGLAYTWSGKPKAVVVTPNVLAGTTLTRIDGAGYGLCVTDADGRILCPGSGLDDFAVVDVSRVGSTLDLDTLSTGGEFSCLLDVVSHPYCWGANVFGELGLGPTQKAHFARPQPVVTSGVLSGVTLAQISAGSDHACAVATNGKAYCWGWGRGGVLGTGTTDDSNVPAAVIDDGALAGVTLTSIDAGGDQTCALSDDARVFCWGHQPGGNTRVPVEVDLSALKAGEHAVTVVSGQALSCLLTDAGRAYCWGQNRLGQLGAGLDVNHVSSPTAVDTSGVLDGVTLRHLVISGDWTTAVCGMSAAGRVFCWGSGRHGMLGNGSYADSNVPVRVDRSGVLADRRVIDIAATYYSMFLVTEPSA